MGGYGRPVLGPIQVKKNGTTIFSVSGVDTKDTATAQVTAVRLGTISGSGINFYGQYDWDDMYWCDSTTIPGEARIDTLRPSADTAQKQWTPSTGSTNYSMLNSTLLQTTTYVEAATVGFEDRYDFADLAAVPTSIYAVSLCSFGKKTDAGTKSMKLSIDDGSAVSYGAEFFLNATSALSPQRVMETRPSAGGAWTGAQVNAMKPGIVEYS